jgi:heme oxygenase
MQRLREHTAAVHAATEELPLMRSLLDGRPTAAGYVRYLATLHGVYAAVEPPLYAALPAPLLTTLGVAPKLPALQRDLVAMSHTANLSPLPRADLSQDVRRLLERAGSWRAAAALGGLYVLEGATLGGQVIARELRARWSGTAGPPTGFLDFRAAHPGHGWRGFGAALNAWAARHPGSEHAILAGAVGVFALMHAAFADAGGGDDSP